MCDPCVDEMWLACLLSVRLASSPCQRQHESRRDLAQLPLSLWAQLHGAQGWFQLSRLWVDFGNWTERENRKCGQATNLKVYLQWKAIALVCFIPSQTASFAGYHRLKSMSLWETVHVQATTFVWYSWKHGFSSMGHNWGTAERR